MDAVRRLSTIAGLRNAEVGRERDARRARGRILTWSCADGFNVMVIAALHAGRGYMMLVASPTALSRTSDVRAFDAARRSFRLLHK